MKFKIGSHEFTGKLSNGNRLDEEEVDIIILELMNSYGMTYDKLKQLHAMEGEALKFDESRYLQPQGFVQLFLVTAGVKNAETLSQILTGEYKFDPSVDNVLSNIAKMGLNKLIDFALEGFMGKEMKKLFDMVKTAGSVASKEYMEYIASEEKVQRAFAAALALEEFYSLCNARIKAKERELGQAQWRLSCNETVITTKTLFGSINVPQIWRLAVDLTQTTPDPVDPNGWGGIYTGVD